MAEQTVPNSGDQRVDAALERIRGKFTDLEDAMVVQAHLEKGITEQLKKHARLLEDHDEVLADHRVMVKRHEVWIAEAAERGRQIDERISNLVSAMGAFI
jgi:predicted  nucleic acid-binding Zn-ribbon protein